MAWILTKYAVTAGVIVMISEVAKRSGKLGALITALPLVAVLAMIWMYVEKQPPEKIGNYAYLTFWYVLPTLPMFLIFPALIGRWGFIGALTASALITLVGFAITARILKAFGIDLL